MLTATRYMFANVDSALLIILVACRTTRLEEIKTTSELQESFRLLDSCMPGADDLNRRALSMDATSDSCIDPALLLAPPPRLPPLRVEIANKRKGADTDFTLPENASTRMNKKRKSHHEGNGGKEKKKSVKNRLPSREIPTQVSFQLQSIVDAFHSLEEADLIRWFATEPWLTCWDSFNPDPHEVAEIRERANDMFDNYVRSQEWREAVCPPSSNAKNNGFDKNVAAKAMKRIGQLADWAQWLALSPEERETANIGKLSPHLFREEIRHWFKTGQDDLTEIAEFLQLHLFGIEIPGSDSERLSPHAQKMKNWFLRNASQRLRFETQLANAPADEAADLEDHTGLMLKEMLSAAEHEEIQFAAEEINSFRAIPEQTLPTASSGPQLDAGFKLQTPKPNGRTKTAFKASPYRKINGWELSQMLQQLHQKSQNPTNEEKVTWLLQAGQKRRLDELSLEDFQTQQDRKRMGKSVLEQNRNQIGKSKRSIRPIPLIRDYWAQFIDRDMSFEQALAKAREMEANGTVPTGPPTATRFIHESPPVGSARAQSATFYVEAESHEANGTEPTGPPTATRIIQASPPMESAYANFDDEAERYELERFEAERLEAERYEAERFEAERFAYE